jgi:hypothetical protein
LALIGACEKINSLLEGFASPLEEDNDDKPIALEHLKESKVVLETLASAYQMRRMVTTQSKAMAPTALDTFMDRLKALIDTGLGTTRMVRRCTFRIPRRTMHYRGGGTPVTPGGNGGSLEERPRDG